MLARNHQCLWHFQNTKEPLAGQACTVAAFVQGAVSASPANLSPKGSLGRDRDAKSRAAPAFFASSFSEREGKPARQREWVVCHARLCSQGLCRAGETSMRTVALPNQQQGVCFDRGAVPFCLSQWGSEWAPATGLSHVQHLGVWLAPPEHGILYLQAWATLGDRAGLPYMEKLEGRLQQGTVPETIPG